MTKNNTKFWITIIILGAMAIAWAIDFTMDEGCDKACRKAGYSSGECVEYYEGDTLCSCINYKIIKKSQIEEEE